MANSARATGGCLCGKVRFEVGVPEKKFSLCHCGMCRRWTSGPFQSVHCDGDIAFAEDEGLAWYRGSPWAERGFCKACGTILFWRFTEAPEREIAVSVASFDGQDGWKIDRHIFTDAMPGYYDFADDRPRLTEAELMKELGIESPPS